MTHVCAICGGEILRIIIEKVNAFGALYDIRYCDRCDLGSTVPVPSREELAGLYAPGRYRTGDGSRFRGAIEKLIRLGRHGRRRRIEKQVEGGRILDIGCGRGLFLDIMKRHGWSVQGVEFDRETANAASKAYGIDVIEEQEMRTRLPDGGFDVVTMYHVLEHLPDPAGMIRECARVLRQGGALVVAVPSLSSLQSAFGGRHWFHLDPPFHLHHFPEAGLRKLMERHSFTVRAVRRFDWEYDIFGWLQTLLNRSGLGRYSLYDLLKTGKVRKERSRDRAGLGLILTFLLLPLFIPVALVLSLSESFLLGKGGTIEVHAVKY